MSTTDFELWTEELGLDSEPRVIVDRGEIVDGAELTDWFVDEDLEQDDVDGIVLDDEDMLSQPFLGRLALCSMLGWLALLPISVVLRAVWP